MNASCFFMFLYWFLFVSCVKENDGCPEMICYGSISGDVRKRRPIPDDSLINVNVDEDYCGNEIISGQYSVSSEGNVQNAVVMIDSIFDSEGVDTAKLNLLEVSGCVLTPRVLIAPKGGMITFKNEDPIGHTAHYYLINGETKKDLLNQALPDKNMEVTTKKPLRKEGLVTVQCDPHNFEQSWIWVLAHPYASVTDINGDFKIDSIPTGPYKLKIWHERFGYKYIDITVKPDKNTNITIEYE
ncbi:MAG: hypothetical protein HQK83_01760 [Fibrobacteria bacterium]|nr:hypothetical protein [Fibrobacteria bacterium]